MSKNISKKSAERVVNSSLEVFTDKYMHRTLKLFRQFFVFTLVITIFSLALFTFSNTQVYAEGAFVFTNHLELGVVGNDVKELQTLLNSKGYNVGTPDGKFGPTTKEQVILFQKANNLTPDGIIGQGARAFLNQLSNPSGGQASIPTTSAAPNVITSIPSSQISTSLDHTLKLSIPRIKGDDVKALQTFLNNSGYNCGIADGIFGPKTEAQVELFQIANNLTPDGKVGKNTLAVISQSLISNSTSNQTSISGCTSFLGFNTITGKSCANTPILSTLGCTSGALFNTITGASCKTLSVLSTGCSSTTNFSTTTGLSCYLPVGCNSILGYSITTGFSCIIRSGINLHHDIIYSLTYTPGAYGSITGTLSQTVNSGTDGTEVIAVLDAGYHFVNWSDLSTTNPRTDTNVLGNISVTANFAINSYNVTFDKNTGDTDADPTTIIADYNTTVTLPTAPTKTGYIFGSWNTLANGTGATFDATTAVTDNITVYAKWTINTYTFTAIPSLGTLTCNGGACSASYNYATSLLMSATSVAGYTVVLSSTGTANGCTSAGGGAGVAATCTAVIPVGNTGITATYTPISYTYNFAGNGATTNPSPTSVTQNYGTSISTPTSPLKTGYTFAVWSPAIPATMPVSGGTSTSQWTINSYTLTLTANGGTLGGTSAGSIVYNTAVSITQTPPTGYSFAGWTGGTCSGTGTCNFNMPASAVTVNATYITDIVINTAAIAGVTAPVAGATPVGTLANGTGYTATISWSPSGGTFGGGTVYTATITLTPMTGYTLTGVTENFFTVAGATTTNPINSGVVTAVFPVTQEYATTPSSITLAVGSTAPVGGVTNVAIPGAGGTDKTGVITGYVATSADKIKFTVVEGGSATSAITINGGVYTSGADYKIIPTTTLPTVIVTTSEAGKITGIRTFVITGPILGTDGLTYGIVMGADGKKWLDRNLGATRIATSFNDYQSYGNLYQWGRGADGHQLITHTSATVATPVNGNTSTLATSDTPGNNLFITSIQSPNDWRNPTNNNLWQGVNGVNNVCPAGFRLPTQPEWSTLITNANITKSATAYSSSLKLTVAGDRDNNSASLFDQGSYGFYWSSSIIPTGTNVFDLLFNASSVDSADNSFHAIGLTVRCLKD